MSKEVLRLIQLAGAHNVTARLLTDDGPGSAHTMYRIEGALTVDWWPYSKKRTAYLLNSKVRHHVASAADVIRMATTVPRRGALDSRSRPRMKRWKKAQYRNAIPSGYLPTCFWCAVPLQKHEATVDHRIPLGRGGRTVHFR